MHRNLSMFVLIFVNLAKIYLALDQNQFGTACNGVVCAEMRTQLQGAEKKTKQAIF